MTERPILFSAPMVLALLAGRKSQTRRILKQPRRKDAAKLLPELLQKIGVGAACPYGQVGDRLWVRETWGYRGSGWTNKKPDVRDVYIEFKADNAKRTVVRPASDDGGMPKQNVPEKFAGVRRASECETDEQFDLSCEYGEWMTRWWKSWRPSIFLPRWASRLSLGVTGVRVERLQDITEADAKAEGLKTDCDEQGILYSGGDLYREDPRAAYRDLWESINGAGSWKDNPWVWVVEFKRAA